ncbi:PREDICTED: uncharacterized protein LOC104588321 [Nelumbo nucifera]|uniref:UDP-N-acetylmuramate dehydrogenase n=2 Tax=Nelumbo nucifera TaxID=4432 RepID=A0A822XL35_NELNU|nr:PREDICTED: uncharacterized protein LOC104588321 [Nelumbo nucifera]DAD20433.1 TPA_asm: hypothetical protein HUJ06_021896 [Nelumbo nucifera]
MLNCGYCCERCIPFIIIGNVSNCLFDDFGFEGCVILNRIDFLERIKPDVYRVGSGYRFNRLGVQCTNEGFSGLEFASGIPGTVGEAAYMNAGANGQETVDAIDIVEIVTVDGRHQILYRSDLAFGYRVSPFQAMQDLAAIVDVTFRLLPSASAKERQQAYLRKKRWSQPMREQATGSVFRNPPGMGVSAGELIQKAGLKSFRVGSAEVSKVHANFIITAAQIPERCLNSLAWLKQELKRNLEYNSESLPTQL